MFNFTHTLLTFISQALLIDTTTQNNQCDLLANDREIQIHTPSFISQQLKTTILLMYMRKYA